MLSFIDRNPISTALATVLAAAAMAFAGLGISGCLDSDEPEPTLTEQVSEMGAGIGGREFVLRLDALLDELEEPVMEVSQESITLWELEVLPFFAYEGLVDFPTVPSAVTLTPYLSPMEHNHILGRAYCAYSPGVDAPNNIEMNARVANPVSAWFGNVGRFLPTLIHEMIHIQGVCGSGEHSETATQVVTYEVLAALANGGNEAAIYPLLEELRDIAMSHLQLEAMIAGTQAEAEFLEFRNTVFESAEERARFDKSLRFWGQSVSHRTQLAYILRAYSSEVWEQLVRAFGNEGLTEPLYLPEAGRDAHSTTEYDGQRPFTIDDLIYFINHAEEIVDEQTETAPPRD